MLLEDLVKEHTNRVPEDDRVADLHHGRLHVERKENAERLCIANLLAQKSEERVLAHEGAVENLPFEQGEAVLQNCGLAVFRDMLDAHRGRGGQA